MWIISDDFLVYRTFLSILSLFNVIFSVLHLDTIAVLVLTCRYRSLLSILHFCGYLFWAFRTMYFLKKKYFCVWQFIHWSSFFLSTLTSFPLFFLLTLRSDPFSILPFHLPFFPPTNVPMCILMCHNMFRVPIFTKLWALQGKKEVAGILYLMAPPPTSGCFSHVIVKMLQSFYYLPSLCLKESFNIIWTLYTFYKNVRGTLTLNSEIFSNLHHIRYFGFKQEEVQIQLSGKGLRQ